LEELCSYRTREEGITAMNASFHEAMEESLLGNHEKLKRFNFAKPEEGIMTKPIFWKSLPPHYYQENGKEVESLLRKLGIEVVVHGHVSRQVGVQHIAEFHEDLPNVTFINNDVTVSRFKKLDSGEVGGNVWGQQK